MRKRIFDLSTLEWRVAGFHPHVWRRERSVEIGEALQADVPPVPARVPGSVQGALREAGLLPDWNEGLNARLCEWVENRHWIYETTLPDAWFESGERFRLRCLGLDFRGVIRFNGQEAASFANAFVPVEVDLTPYRLERNNRLQIVFECPPRWLGQFGWTPRMTDWKPRFNYHWDWTARLVQIGIWDDILLEAVGSAELGEPDVEVSFDPDEGRGRLVVRGSAAGPDDARVQVVLSRAGTVVMRERVTPQEYERKGVAWERLPVEPWWPNGEGPGVLYDLTVELLAGDRTVLDSKDRRIGFRDLRWEPCEGAPSGADPWICVVNGRRIFLQGVNWTPIRPNFADVDREEYRRRLELYRELGCNLLRVWGGACLEKEWFYDLCDELGLFVWQEFPLSSSGIDNRPPSDERSLRDLVEIAESYVRRRRHHASLALWCGGNELADDHVPVGLEHPLLAAFGDVVRRMDPGRRFLPTSPSGPRYVAVEKEFGKGLHWDVHGPWKAEPDLDLWRKYWAADDALFRSETGAPGPSPVELILRTRGDLEAFPPRPDNPLWARTPWWLEWDAFLWEKGREPESLEEYVEWGQRRQAEALETAARACKGRFPRCGGFLVWMGHDCFPCAANTAIVDFDGNPKPAARALARVFREDPGGGAGESASAEDPAGK